MKLYHATTRENWELIQTEGLKPMPGYTIELNDGTVGRIIVENLSEEARKKLDEALSFIYMTEDKKVAKRWGQILIEIDADKLDASLLGREHENLCDILGTPDFYHYKAIIPPAHFKRVL